MELLKTLNSPVLYLICGAIIAFVAAICVIFALRAYRMGKEMGIDEGKMKRVITASATFAVLPSVGILLGVIALSGSLGTPWPWLRLSVIGALHYETQVAEAAAEAAGIGGLSILHMTPEAFATIALVMSFCIMWGMVLVIINGKAYTKRLQSPGTVSKTEAVKADSVKTDAEKTGSVKTVSENTNAANAGAGNADAAKPAKKKSPFAGFGDTAMTAMFIGLVSAYIASYIGTIVSGAGVFTFAGSGLPLAVAVVAALAMAVFIMIKNKTKADWVDSFSVAGSMLVAMAAAVLLGQIAG